MLRSLVFGSIVALSILVGLTRATESIDLHVLDLQFKTLRAWFPRPAAEIVVVGIDEGTIDRIPEPLPLWHRHLAGFLSALGAVKPAAVGIDIVLPDRSFESIAPGTDSTLIRGLLDARRNYPLVLALTVDASGTTRKVHTPFIAIAGSAGIGYALFPIDGDGVVRRFDERISKDGEVVPTFAGQLGRSLGKAVTYGYIDYSRGVQYHYVPFSRVIEWIDRDDARALDAAFKGKPVLLGIIDKFNDRRATPAKLAAWESEASDTPGVLINAQALRNIADGGFVQRVPQGWVALAAAIFACTWLISASAITIGVLVAALFSLLFAVSISAIANGWFMPVLPIALAIALGLGIRHAWDTTERLIERRRLRASFAGYVSPNVMEEILSGHIKPELGGAEKFVCVLFSDIRGYTTRSEGMTAPQVVAFLNRYFDRVVKCIHDHEGAIICFMGDGIMAAFGAAKSLPNPCQSAFDAAQGLIRNVVELNKEFSAENQKPIDIGIGLHAGTAVVGHIGSRDRHDYSAVGDVTNVASRLESLTKGTSYRLIVSKEVADALVGDPGLVDLGALEVRGHTPVKALGFGAVASASSP